MATNIEQIFRSFVVSKFREIQEKQLGSGKLGQQNGEINSSEEENSVNDTVASLGTLQNDPLVQKIEQVLSEVLGAEPQYKPDVEQNTVKSKSCSTKRGISDEVQDEIPRKKSKKDKKHKDKKKKKKRKKEKKEKKYKKQPKESKLNCDHKVCEGVQPASHFSPESLVLSTENVDIEPASPLKHGSDWFMEKPVYENLNSSLSNSHNVSNLDSSKLNAPEKDYVLTSIQDLYEPELINESELENYTCQHTSLTVNLHKEDKSLNTADVEGDDTRMATVAATSTKEMEQPEDNTRLLITENLSIPENSPKFMAVEPEGLEMSVESCSVEVKELESLSESLDSEIMSEAESTSFEKTGCKLMKTPLETIVEAKDSVTTLGFLAMVVGKDFEATSEFLNKAKVKADVTDELEQGSERIAMMNDLEGISESVCIVTEKHLASSLALKPKIWPEDSERITELDECKGIEASVDAETVEGVRELKDTQTSTSLMELNEPLKDQASLEIVADMKDYKRIPELEIIKRTDSVAHYLATEEETKKLEAATEFKEVDGRCLRATSVCESEKEKQDIIPETPRMVGVKNLDGVPKFAGVIRVNYLEASLETVAEDKGGLDATEHSKTVVELNVSENIPRSEAVPEINELETATATLDIAKTQYLDVSKYVATTEIESETVVNLKDLKILPEQPSVHLKNLETVSEALCMTEMKHVKDVLQSDAVVQGKDSETNLKLEGQGERRDLDATSESLHMIFTNYSEHSLEIYPEPEVMMELKNSERVPELLPMEDSNTSEALLAREVKDVTSIESAAIVKLNDLGGKPKYLQRDEKIRGAESEAVADMKHLKAIIPSEVVTKEKNIEIVSHSVTGVTEKALDTTAYVGKGQDGGETADLEIKSGCQKVKDITEREPSAEIRGPLFISESFQEVNIVSSETTPELTMIQQLKETGKVTPVLGADSPHKTSGPEDSALFVPKDAPKHLNTEDDLESVSGHHAVQNQESLQLGKAKVREVNLDSKHALEVKYSAASAELPFSDELSNLQKKQKWEESTGTINLTAAPDSLYTLGTDLIVASEPGQLEKVIDSEHSSRSLDMAQTNSDNFLKSLYMMPLKDSKTISKSKTTDAMEIDSESSHRAASDSENLPENESIVASQVLQIIEDSPKTNNIEESNTAIGNNALSVPDLEGDSETVHVRDIENLEAVKTTHVAPASLFTQGMIGIEDMPITVCAEEENVKASETATVEVKKLVASATSVDTLKADFDPTHITDTKDSEANQILETDLESVEKREVDTEFDHEAAPIGLEIFEKHKSVVGTSTSEGILPAVNKAEGKDSCTELTLETVLVEKYSESVSASVEVSETEDCDATLSMFLIDVKDSESTSVLVDAGEVKALKTMLPFETTPEPLCVLELEDSDDVVESVLTSEMRNLGETLNCDVVLDARDPVPTATNLNTSELKSSSSVYMLEMTDSEGMPKLKTTPAYLSSADLQSSDTTVEIETLNIIDSEIPVKSETEVKYFESVSETDYVREPFRYKAVLQSECISEEKVSEITSEAVSMKEVGDLETTPESLHAQEIKDLEPFTQSVCTVQAKCMEGKLIYEEVLDVSETSQYSSTVEIAPKSSSTLSVVAEMGKYSEKSQLHFEEKCPETATEFAHVLAVVDTYADVQPDGRAEGKYSESTAEIATVVDIKSTETNSSIVSEVKDTAFLESKTGPETVHLKDLEAVPKDESVSKAKDLQGLQSFVDKDEEMCLEGSSKSLLILEEQDLERDSTSMLLSEKVSEVSLESVSVVKAKNSEAALKYVNGKSLEISEQSSEYICMEEIKGLKAASGHAVLGKAENSEMFSKVTSEVKELESTLEPLCLMKEKDSEAATATSLEEPVLKASVKPVCVAGEENLAASKQVTMEVKDSEAVLAPMTMPEKDLESTSCGSLKDQYSEAVPKSLEIMKENDGSVSKDRKSEKISSKSKDKSKGGKKAKKSRSKSPSKSKKRKKKSRSHSTSRQTSSRRPRSRSKNDSDSRRKHSTSRRKSRSKSTDRKEGKESSLRSRRRRSRTSDRHKSRSKSVDKRESSLRSRRRRSRSSDRRKSRSRSVDRRESARTRRRLSRSSDNHKSRSKSVDKRETSRSRRRRSRSSDHRKSRSRSIDRRETSTRTRRRWSRSSDNHRSRSRSVYKRDTSLRRRTRQSRSSDNYKSRSKSVDRRESSVRSRRRRSRSSDHRKSRSRSGDDKREISVRTRRKRSRSSEIRRSRSADRRESLRIKQRSSDNHKSRSRSGDRETLRTRRRRSRSSANRKSRSKSVDKQEPSVRTRRQRSRSPDNRKSRSKSVDKRESSMRTKRRRSRSSDRKSRSKSVDTRETSARAKSRRSRSSDNRKSRSKSTDKRETSAKAKRRSRSSDNRKSRSKSIDKRETPARAKSRRSRSSDNRKSRSKSIDKRETSARAKRRRSRSSDNHKSRSKSVDKIDISARSKRRRSKSSDHKSVTKSGEKRESSLKSRHRRSESTDRQKSKSKSRSKSSERKKEKDSADGSKGKCSKSRSKSKSPEKTEGVESLEVSVCNRAKSPEHPKSKSRSRSKSLDKTEDRDRLRRSRSKGSESKSRGHRPVSRSRRNRSHSLTRKRGSRSKSEHRSRSRSRSRSCSRRWRRTRSKSVSRQRSLSRERRRRSRRNRSRSVDRRRRRSDSRESYRITLRLRSRSRTPVRLRTSRSTGRRRSSSVSPDHRRSRSSSRSPKRLTDLDKAQLLEIAKANAAAMCAKAGVPLPPSLMPVVTPEKKEEKVTQKSAKETIMELTEKCKKIAQSQEDDVIVNKPHVSDEEEEEHPFINHPFKLNEPKPIFFNLTTPTIKPAPPKNQVTLTKEFPVSSGSQHRKKEADSAYGEWVPVEKNKEENKDDVFPNPATLEPVDISSALNERTVAQKRLTENTFDLEAMCLLNRAQERIDAWAQLNSLPGQFTGSTGAQVLSSEQLSNSGPQAWIKKDQFLRAAPVSGGMGAQLMRKMGWREGEGLGKNKEGSKEPILVDFKTDRKGLVAIGEKTQKRLGAFGAVKDLAGKHPISLLMEACNKRRWPPPIFVLVTDNGPDHRKCFLFKVMVNGVEHKPNFASPNKKLAKATAATVALQALGIVPKDLLANATSFRSASHN